MNNIIVSDKNTLIIGAGKTGLSVARFFVKENIRCSIYDDKFSESIEVQLIALGVEIRKRTNNQFDQILDGITRVVLSPGYPRSSELVQLALKYDLEVVNDIALFLKCANAPVVGITGSNGKSTITTMFAKCCERAGMRVGVGGNIGTPALDILDDDVEIYVLELSSFQLESVDIPALDVGVLLNVTPDHMDRYESFQEYCRVKKKIFFSARNVVYSLDDLLTQPPIVAGVRRFGFGLNKKTEQNEEQYYFEETTGTLRYCSSELMRVKDIKQLGSHNVQNVLALFAIASAVGIAFKNVVAIASSYPGLPHRCEFVTKNKGVVFINDSKATNTGAAEAAIRGFSDGVNQIILIAGGVGKGADFSTFAELLVESIYAVVLIGEEAQALNELIAGRVSTGFAKTMLEAVAIAYEFAKNKEAYILLSPACASFDMFETYQHRGECFKQAVAEVIAA